jgi:hypothetical protein
MESVYKQTKSNGISMNDMVICFASRHGDAHKCDTWKTMHYCLGDNITSEDFKLNNTDSLAKVYNHFIDKWKRETDWLVLVHDDIKLPRGFDIYHALQNSGYDICGLAGATSITPKEPALWHLMSKREDWRGAVSHPVNEKQHMVTSFGPMPARTLIIDGLFIGIRTEILLDNPELRFDESNPGKWHHYDLDFCLTANKCKKKIGVVDVPVIHNSPGLKSLEDDAFKSSQEWFLKKWSNS